MEGPKKLTIDRSIWLHSEGPSRSFLHRKSDGKRCCLGIYLGACGLSDEELGVHQSPAGCTIDGDGPTVTLARVPDWLLERDIDGKTVGCNSSAAVDLMEENDTDGGDQEARIARLFKEEGDCEVTFVDGEGK